jgi:four helix bundle protein
MTTAEILKTRTFNFAVATFRLCRPLMRDPEMRIPGGQLVRASASVAANYRATCRAKSKRDLIATLGTQPNQQSPIVNQQFSVSS